MYEAKKEEAAKKNNVNEIDTEEAKERINVMNIAVEDNFDIDDI